MKRLLVATFLLFYTTLTVVRVAENTSVSAASFASTGKPQTSLKRAYPPHASQTRFLEQAFVVERASVESPLVSVANTHPPALEQFADNLDHPVPSRAPPALS
jgi:hypothetical protein